MSTAELYEKINRGHLNWVDFGWRKGQTTWQRLCDLEDLKTLMPSRPAKDLQRKVEKSVEAQAPERVVTRSGSRSGAQATPPSHPSAEPRIWFLHYNSSQYGPFTQGEVQRAIEIGKINLSVHVWSHGMPGWEKLEQVPAFQKSGVESPRPPASAAPAKLRARSEKRETPRRPMVAQVLMSDEQTVIVGICRDISVGGLQVLTDRAPAPVGSKLKMNISPSGDGSGKGFQPFVAEGTVVRILEDERGFSFRFSRLSDGAKRSVEDYLESAE